MLTTDSAARPSRLTIFAFLWACQALVHQEFYSKWLVEGDVAGWVLTVFALLTLVRPSSLVLFVGMLASSVVYNVLKWPFVVNHILVETIINLTIVAALVKTWRAEPVASRFNEEWRDRAFAVFAPVLTGMLLLVYYFAFVAKLNWDFVNPDVSCVVVMYGDLLRRFPFLPSAATAGGAAIVLTLIVEAALPLLLTFKRTRYWGVLMGVAFHLILGLVGHRTFSALACALYGMLCIDELQTAVAAGQRFLAARLSQRTRTVCCRALTVIIVCGVAALIAADWTGNYRAGIGPLKVYRIPWGLWILWMLACGAIFSWCGWLYYRGAGRESTAVSKPGWIWALAGLVVLNGVSQYIGLKTETCFTMYSNLRTEGSYNNHMFLPAIRLATYQDDLVEIVDASIPQLQQIRDDEQLLTSFELRRVLSTTAGDFDVAYRRGGRHYRVYRRGDEISHSDLLRPHPVWMAKLMLFRPVSTSECAPCQH